MLVVFKICELRWNFGLRRKEVNRKLERTA
jgi:hypothetical protein